jgi:hypothetical protein
MPRNAAYSEAMRMVAIVAALALAPSALALAPHVYTAVSVQRSFHTQTGMRLVKLPAESTSALTTLSTKAERTDRFGGFDLYVLRPATATRTKKQLLGAAGKNRQGIYWIFAGGGDEGSGGWAAVTLFGKNLVCKWTSEAGSKRVNARWLRLQRALRKVS